MRSRPCAGAHPARAMSAAAIIVAAGEGTRMQSNKNKVFLEVRGRSILDYSLDLLESSGRIDEVVLVTRASDLRVCESLKERFSKLHTVIAGGNMRRRSEFVSLKALPDPVDAQQMQSVLL